MASENPIKIIPWKQFVTFCFHQPIVVWVLGTSRNFQIGVSFECSVISGTQQSVPLTARKSACLFSPEDLGFHVWDQGSPLLTLRGKEVFS